MKDRFISILKSIPLRYLATGTSLLLLLPSFAILFFSCQQERINVRTHIENSLSQLSDELADDQLDAVATAENIAHLLSHLPEVRQRNAPAIRPILNKLTQQNEQIEQIMLADPNGKVFAATPGISVNSIADNPCFRQTLATGKPASGEYNSLLHNSRAIIWLNFPLSVGKGDFNGVIMIGYGLKGFDSAMSKINYHNHSLGIFDRNGTRTYSNLFPQYVGRPDRAEAFSFMKNHPAARATFESLGNDGMMRLFHFRKLVLKGESTPYLYIRVGLPIESVYAGINNKFRLELTILVAIYALALLMAWFVGKFLLVDRIRQLHAASQAVAKHDYAVRITNEGGAELGQLAQSFNTMVQQLQHKERAHLLYEAELQERLHSEQLLDILLNSVQESICLITQDGFIAKANTVFASRLGQTVDSVLGRSIYDLFPPDVAESRKVRYEEVLATKCAITFEDNRDNFSFINSVSPVLDKSNDVAYLAIYATDITLLKEFDNELMSANLKLQAFNQKIDETREEERRYIARELHDQMGQALTGLNMDLNWLVGRLDDDTKEKLNSHIVGMHIATENMIAMVRSISAELSPPLLENLGLGPAIGHYVQEFERKSSIACHLMLDEEAGECFAKQHAVDIFRVLQEALTNIARHAHADEVAVSMCLTAHMMVLEVADNGIGINDCEVNSIASIGVIGMKERAKKCKGTLLLQGKTGLGTIVRLEIPRQGES